MFKSSSDQISYIKRVASHATKPRASGLIEDIPPWAAEPEEYYNSIRDQYRSLADQLAKGRAALGEIKEKLKVSLPFREYEHLQQHHDRLANRVYALEQQASDYRELARAAGTKAWQTCFFHVAVRLLQPQDLRVLLDETQLLLGREETEIKRGLGEMTPQQRSAQQVKDRRKGRRQKFRKWHQDQQGHVRVWRDNEPVQEKYKK